MVQHHYRPMYYALATRLGELRGVIFDVNADGVQKHCVGFHKPVSNKVFVKGFVCSRDPADVTPQNAACLVDRIRFVRPADEAALKSSLAPGESRNCGATLLDPQNDASEKTAKDTL
jgi:hypothetical protein